MITSNVNTKFRLMMAWAPLSGVRPLEIAASWLDKLNDGNSPEIHACIWITQGSMSQVTPAYADRFCWHFLQLPNSVDKYVRGPIPGGSWSPWGNKSGPNYQFFKQLDGMASAHEDSWVLQVEGDTFSIADSPRNSIQGVIDAHPDAWVIGGVNHPAVLLSLPSKLHQHINGAALYNVASTEFHQFRKGVWIPSLIEALQQDAMLAYDCMSSPGLQETLSSTLRQGWYANNSRFVRTPGIINASTLSFEDPANPPKVELEFVSDSRGATNKVWLFHAKEKKVRKTNKSSRAIEN